MHAALGLASVLALAAPLQARETTCPWRLAWASSQYVAEGDNALPAETYKNRTLREIVRTTLPGTALRVRLSNAFGTMPLTIGGGSVARSPDNKSAAVASLRPLTFNGARAVTIPAGADMLSDPVTLATPAFTDIAVSIHYTAAPSVQTGHPGSRATSYLAPGNQVDAPILTDAATADRWFNLSAIEVQNCGAKPVIVALGDSITDGRGSTTNGNDRWPDVLARRLNGQAAIINRGIGGNRLLLDGLGPNALARLERDVLSVPGITHLIVLEGINDLGTSTRDAPMDEAGHKALVAQMIGAYRQIVERARAHGIKVIGGTIMPFMGFAGYHPDAANEADRQAVNTWIRAPGNFDAVVDFDAVMLDPAHPDRLNPAYDVGDHLHPNPAGYKAMGKAVPVKLIRP
ncbi:MAG: SGNH/GDSL hydrolase family protein [Sphingobium sp.]|nr:SGNH/GDSL hydrolase family protein [Sphingobium sp.]